MKALKTLVVPAAVVLVIAAAAISSRLGAGVKLAIERLGPGIVGAPVTVGSASLAPWSGRLTLTNLVVGNPPGFKGARALSVGVVDVRLKVSSLVADTIVVESVTLREPEIDYELGGGGSNLARLQRNAEGARGKAPEAAPGKPSKSLLVKDLLVTGGRVGVQGVKIALPGVHLTNLGGKGRSPAQAVSETLSAVAASAARAASGAGTKALGEAARTVLGNLGGMFGGKK